MFAPPGVDSDSSDEEDLIPASPPKPPPKPSFLKTLLTSSKKLNEQAEKAKISSMTPIQAAEGLTPPRPPTPPRGKRVRIHLEGEEHPDQVDLIASPIQPDSPSSSSSMDVIPSGATTPLSVLGSLNDGKRPAEIAGEILILLQKIMAESAAQSRPSSPPLAATLTPLANSQDDLQSTAEAGPYHANTDNALGLAGLSTDQGLVKPQKKHSKMSTFLKLAQMHSPTKPSSQQAQQSQASQGGPQFPASNSQNGSPIGSTGTAAPPYASPTFSGLPAGVTGSTTPPWIGASNLGQYHRPPNQQQYQAPFQNQDNPETTNSPPQPFSDPQPPWSLPAQQYQSSAQPPDSSQLNYGSAQEYYQGNIVPSAPYPHHTAPVMSQDQHQGSVSTPPSMNGSANPSPPQGWGFNLSNVPSAAFTQWTSHWQPGQPHWQQPTLTPAQKPDTSNVVNGQTPRDLTAAPAMESQQFHPTSTQISAEQPHNAALAPSVPSLFTGYPPSAVPHPPHSAPSWVYAPQPAFHSPPPAYPPSPLYYSPPFPAYYPLPYPVYHRANALPPSSAPLPGVGTAQQQSSVSQAEPNSVVDTHSPVPPNSTTPAFEPSNNPISAPNITSNPMLIDTANAQSMTRDVLDGSPAAGTQHLATKDKGSLLSPRIVIKRDDGFKEVDPYPSARVITSKSRQTSPKHGEPKSSPPPRYSTMDRTAPADTPRKVKLEELPEGRKKEYEAMIKKRQEEKVRAKASEGSLSPEQVEIAMKKAAGAHKRDQEEIKPSSAPTSKSKDLALVASPTAGPSSGPRKDQIEKQEAISKELDQLRKQREKVKRKAQKGEMEPEQARMTLAKIERAMIRLKADLSGKTSRPTEMTQDKEAARSRAKEIKEGLDVPDVKGKGKEVERRGAPDQDKLNGAGDPQRHERSVLESRVAEIKDRKDGVKEKVAKGRLSKEEAKKELSRLASTEDKVRSELDSMSSEVQTSKGGENGRGPGRLAGQTVSEAATRSPNMEEAVEKQLEETRARMKRIKAKVAEGALSKEDGKKEMMRLTEKEASLKAKMKDDMLVSATPNAAGDNGPATGKKREEIALAKDDHKSPSVTRDSDRFKIEKDEKSEEEELQKRIKRIKVKISEGVMSKEEGKRELTRLAQKQEALATEKTSNSAHSGTEHDKRPSNKPERDFHTVPLSSAGIEASSVDVSSESKTQREELKRRIESVKRKMTQGSISKEDGKKGIARLVQHLTEFEDRAKHDTDKRTRGSNTSRPGSPRQIATDARNEGASTSFPDPSFTKLASFDKQIDRIKRKIAEGKVDKQEGQEQLLKLKRLRDGLVAATKDEKPAPTSKRATVPDQPLRDPQSDSTSVKTDLKDEDKLLKAKPAIEEPDLKRQQLVERLSKNKEKLLRLQEKVNKASDTDRPTIENALKQLEKERKELKIAVANLDTSMAGDPSKRSNKQDSKVVKTKDNKDAAEDEEELDQEALKEILKYDIPSPAPAPRSDDEAKPEVKSTVAAPQSDEVSSTQSSGSTPPVPGSYPRDSTGRKQQRQESKLPFPTYVPPKNEKLSPDPASSLPRTAEMADERRSDARQKDLLIQPAMQESVKRGRGDAFTPSATRGEMSPTWSSCLVSIANCIHLANHLLARFIVHHKVENGQQGLGIVVEMLPRLLTAMLLKQDLEGVLQRLFGQGSQDSLDGFVAHVSHIQSYLESIESKTTHSKTQSPKEDLQSIISVFDHLLRLSSYLSPQVMSSLKQLLFDWKKEGLSINKILHTIRFVKSELMISPHSPDKHKRLSHSADEGSGEVGLLEHLIDLLDFPPEGGMSRDDDESSKSRRSSLHPSHTPSDPRKVPSPAADQPHGVRERLSSMVHSLRHRSPSSPPHTAPLPPSTDTTGLTRPLQPRPRHAHMSENQEELQHRRHLEPGLTIISESLSPTSKRKVAHHLNPLHPKEVVHEEYHPPHSAPHLHLPPTTADFLTHGVFSTLETPTGRSTTPKVPPRRRHASTTTRDPTQTEVRLHHVPETTIVRPPGPEFDAKGSGHEVRRPSAYSSDSHYSAESHDSERTIDSDEEARELLAMADSGPQPVTKGDHDVDSDSGPDDDQIKRAKEVLKVRS